MVKLVIGKESEFQTRKKRGGLIVSMDYSKIENIKSYIKYLICLRNKMK